MAKKKLEAKPGYGKLLDAWVAPVMGEDYKVDFRTTDKLADRIPFPAEAAAELAFQLGVAE